MNIPKTTKNELQGLCKRIVEILGLRQGSIKVRPDTFEAHCHKGEPKQGRITKTYELDGVVVEMDDKSIKFEESE